MDKKEQLKKFGYTIQKRRQALNLSVRELALKSGISAALISKLENAVMKNFPKYITIEHLSKSLEFKNNELFTLANILFNNKNKKNMPAKNSNSEEKMRKFLATSTDLSPENIHQTIYFIKGLELMQKINSLKKQ